MEQQAHRFSDPSLEKITLTHTAEALGVGEPTFRRVGAMPNVARYAVHLQTIVGPVASGVGIAVLPGSARRVWRAGVVYRRLDATSWMGPA